MQHRDFHYRHFLPEVILQCLRWYLRYPISYRDLEEMMIERGVNVDHTTLYSWYKLTLLNWLSAYVIIPNLILPRGELMKLILK